MKEELKELIKEKILKEGMNLDETIDYILSLKNDQTKETKQV